MTKKMIPFNDVRVVELQKALVVYDPKSGKQVKLTQNGLAQKLGVTRSTLTEWLRNKTIPYDRLEDLANALGTSHSEVRQPFTGLRALRAENGHIFELLLQEMDSRKQKLVAILEDLRKHKKIVVVHGPSGSGKSTLVHAGLRHRLGNVQVLDISQYDSVSVDHFETNSRSLLPESSTVLIFDQFEQAIVAPSHLSLQKLKDMIRKCDGEVLQAVIVVRAEAYSGLTGMLAELGELSFPNHRIGLCDRGEAQRVLGFFGRWLGCLEEQRHKAFVTEAIEALCDNNEIAPVKLVLFTEMYKDQPWTSVTANSFDEIGYRYMNQLFEQSWLEPFRTATQKLIMGLVVEKKQAGTDTLVRTQLTLSEMASIAECTPEALQILIGYLDTHKLITPVAQDASSVAYQLTHDYLVQPLSKWSADALKESPRSLMRDYTRMRHTSAKPSWPHWKLILSVPPEEWSSESREMMDAAIAFIASDRAERIVSSNVRDLRSILDEFQELPGSGKGPHGYLSKTLDAIASNLESALGLSDNGRLNRVLALQAIASVSMEDLIDELLIADVSQLPLIIDSLQRIPSKPKLQATLVAHQEALGKSLEPKRLRANAALSKLFPSVFECTADGKVDQLFRDLAEISGDNFSSWLDLFVPIADALTALAKRVYADTTRLYTDRLCAIDMMIHYFSSTTTLTTESSSASHQENGVHLLECLLNADADHFDRVYKAYSATDINRSDTSRYLLNELNQGTGSQEQENRKANAVNMLQLLNPERNILKDKLESSSLGLDARNKVIHRMAPSGFEFNKLSAWLARWSQNANSKATYLRSLILALGHYPEYDSDSRQKGYVIKSVSSILEESFLHAGVESSVNWLIRKWNHNPIEKKKSLREIVAHLANGRLSDPISFKSPNGPDMIVAPYVDQFQMGTPPGSVYHGIDPCIKISFKRIFCVSRCLVTWGEFKRFLDDTNGLERFQREVDSDLWNSYPLNDTYCDFPVHFVSLQEAENYCNWLTDQERNSSVRSDHQSRYHYRLPTEAELEFITRAGTTTDRCFGDSTELLHAYAWCSNSKNRAQKTGVLAPNDWGFHDVHGNCYSWCKHNQDAYSIEKGSTVGDEVFEDIVERPLREAERTKQTKGELQWSVRGGAFFDPPHEVRSAYRYSQSPANRKHFIGFRIAMTLMDIGPSDEASPSSLTK